MKKIILVINIVFSFILHSQAQTKITRPIETLGFNENTVVISDNGKKIAYQEWKNLLASGKYKLQPIDHDSDTTKFLLIKIDFASENKKLVNTQKPDETTFFKNGNPFIFTDMKEITGTAIPASSLKGKIIVLNFWFIACPPCRYEMPEFNRLAYSFKRNKGIIFIAISVDKIADIKKFLKVSPFNFHLIGESKQLFESYGVNQCPATLVIDRKGIIRFNSQGYGNGSVPYWVRQTIKAIN
jgi:peroxiredoxin